MQEFSSFGRKKKMTKIRHRSVMLRRFQLFLACTTQMNSRREIVTLFSTIAKIQSKQIGQPLIFVFGGE